MEQYIPKSVLVAEIEKRITEGEKVKEVPSSAILGLIQAYKNTLSFIDSLQEEPVCEDLEEAATMYAKEEYSRKNPATLPDRCIGCYAPLIYAFKDGAQWQKEQFEKNRLKHCNSITNEQAELEQGFIDQHLDKYQRMPTFLDAIEYGMKFQKEQMMKDSVNAIIDHPFPKFEFPNLFPDYRELKDFAKRHNLKDEDKVKVIIIK